MGSTYRHGTQRGPRTRPAVRRIANEAARTVALLESELTARLAAGLVTQLAQNHAASAPRDAELDAGPHWNSRRCYEKRKVYESAPTPAASPALHYVQKFKDHSPTRISRVQDVPRPDQLPGL